MQYLFLIHHNLCLFTLHTYCDKKSIKGVNCNVNVTAVLCTVSREPSHKNINYKLITNFLSVLCSSLGPSLSLSPPWPSSSRRWSKFVTFHSVSPRG